MHRCSGGRLLGLLTLATALLSLSPSHAQQRFRAGVDVLHIQVGVTDEDGDFVPGLTSEDFVLEVDGEMREIVTAWAIDSDDPHESWLSPVSRIDPEFTEAKQARVRTLETLPGAARRRFLLFVDLARMTRSGLHNTRRVVRDFLASQVRPADLLGLTVYSPRRGLEYLVPFTSDHEAIARRFAEVDVARAAERVPEEGDGIPMDDLIEFYANDTEIPALVEEIEQTRLAAATESMVDALRALGATLTGTEGRKHVLMFSHGLSDSILENPAVTDAIEEFAATARASDVVFHTFEPGNVATSSVHDIREMESGWEPGSSRGDWEAPRTFVIRDRAVLHYIAEETGGRASFWRGAMKKGMERIERATNDYYLLAFPLNDTDGDTLEIDVTVRRPDVEVSWAPRRLRVGGETGSPTPFRRSFEIAEALEVGAERNDLDASLRAWILPPDGHERSRVAVVAEVGGSMLEILRSTNADGQADLEVLGFTVTPSRQVLDYFRGTARVDLTAASPGEPILPFRFASWLRVPPGRHYVKVLIREAESGRLVSRSLVVSVPDQSTSNLRLDSPLVVLPPTLAPMLRGLPSSSVEVRQARQSNSERDELEIDETGPDIAPADENLNASEDPFSVNGLPVTIDLSGMARPGNEIALLAIVHGVTAHPDTHQPRVALSASLAGADGYLAPLPDLSVIRADWRPDHDVLRVIIRAAVPPDVPNGAYRLRLTAADAIGGTDAQSETDVTVLAR